MQLDELGGKYTPMKPLPQSTNIFFNSKEKHFL